MFTEWYYSWHFFPSCSFNGSAICKTAMTTTSDIYIVLNVQRRKWKQRYRGTEEKKGDRFEQCRAVTTRHYTHFKRFSITPCWWCADRTYETGILCAFHSLYASFCALLCSCHRFIGSFISFIRFCCSQFWILNSRWIPVCIFVIRHRSSRIMHAEQVVSWSGILSCCWISFYLILFFVNFLFVWILFNVFCLVYSFNATDSCHFIQHVFPYFHNILWCSLRIPIAKTMFP